MILRTATPGDINALKELYYGTITSINIKDYNPEQIKAWAATAERTESLLRKINEQYFYIAETADKTITGFASLETSGYLDMMYVHKGFQGQGIATQLLKKIIETATTLGIQTIESEVSITAKPFFEKHHFIAVQQQVVVINNMQLTNYKMLLAL